ncbi:penicillin-binding protein 1A [Roseimicrobium gellanilyticum]|uniref:Penicillin-binding protein 1A n=1 Tax=Roseimicrobium gellanilyticum TaxID=748857 RepID=A0A366H2Y7_9BACT|nr:transglycosylase domain-containing protein [Roseimicrobium gellanilyticum]RBP36318.1 penicillin-binding protein 1A [Roseimicrobium gellanilyticum]
MSDLPLPSAPRPRRRGLRILTTLLLILFFMGLAGLAVGIIIYGNLAKQYDLTKLGEMKERSVVLDTKGREIGKLHGENRVVVPISQVSKHFIDALLAREDARFYDHGGVDYVGVARAAVRNFKDKKTVQGASTITMQLARNSFDGLNEKTLHRKLVEVMLARRIEAEKTKDDILELYVNRIFFGSGLYGIERASKAYFGKSASQLTAGEGAMLAGIIRSPNRFSPFRNWKGALVERDDVLGRMVVKKMLTQEEADAAKKEEIAVVAQPLISNQDNYAMEAVRRDLELILEESEIEDGGLIVHTTLDLDLQKAAEQSLEKRLTEVEKQKGYKHPTKAQFDAAWDGVSEPSNTPYLQGGVLMLNNRTGGILAVVGGRSYPQSRFNRALQGNRPIGSTIKPFIYATAFMHGLLPGSLVEDAPMREGELKDGDGYWSPGNADGKFLGFQPASVGLVRSRNAMTVRVGNFAGLDSVLMTLRDTGLGEPEVRTPQIYIGNMGTSLKSLTSATSVFPNNGIRRRPFLISSITDAAGEIVYSTPVLESEGMPPGAALVTERLMEKVMNEGTGAPARKEYGFKEKAGGKTGTTNDYKDAWFVGFTSEVTCGVWVGLDQPDTIAPGGYGGKLALPIWADSMNVAVASGYKQEVQKAEPVLARVNLCRLTGLLATDGCAAAGHAYADDLPAEMVPPGYCDAHGGRVVVERRQGDSKPGFFKRVFNGLFR